MHFALARLIITLTLSTVLIAYSNRGPTDEPAIQSADDGKLEVCLQQGKLTMVLQVGTAAVGCVDVCTGESPENREEIRFTLRDVTVSGLGLPEDITGLLTVTNRRMCWHSCAPDAGGSSDVGLSVPLVDIALHAISRDSSGGTRPCIYSQVGDEDEELRLFPLCPDEDLGEIFDAMCAASALCVDGAVDEDSESENNDDDDYGIGGGMFNAQDITCPDQRFEVNGNGGEHIGFAKGDEVLDDCRFEDVDETGGNSTQS